MGHSISDIYQSIMNGEPGHAIANIRRQDVAYHKGDDAFGHPDGTTMLRGKKLTYAMIKSIAKGKLLDISGEPGLATPQTFYMSDLNRLIDLLTTGAATSRDRKDAGSIIGYYKQNPDVFIGDGSIF